MSRIYKKVCAAAYFFKYPFLYVFPEKKATRKHNEKTRTNQGGKTMKNMIIAQTYECDG